jgi:hypothetical protein
VTTVVRLLKPQTKRQRLALGPMRLAALAPTFIIPLFISAGAAFGADQVHDEIQVYNAEIASVGQWTYQQHLNYAAIGKSQPEVPGGFSSNQGTPEFAYGLDSVARATPEFCCYAQPNNPVSK